MSGRIVGVTADPGTLLRTLETAWVRRDVPLLLPPDDAPLPEGLAAALERPPSLHPDAAVVVLTSGSTGRPRGVVLTHGALEASVNATNARLGCSPGDRWALALPVHHVAGLMVLLRARALGTEPLGLPTAERAHVSLVAVQLARLLDAGADLTRFATILVGGGPTPPGLLAAARAAGGRIITSYGMTETCGGCVHDGVPLDGTEVDVLPDGRIRLRGPVLAAGYLDARSGRSGPDGTRPDDGGFRPDGWFVTNDRGRLDGGRLVVEGRADDVILTGGESVPAAAVRRALLTHPEVVDAVVVGVPDAEWGQRVRAIVEPRTATAAPGLGALRAHVRRTLPSSHAPTELVVVELLPRDGMGKVTAADREALGRRAADEVHGAGPRPLR